MSYFKMLPSKRETKEAISTKEWDFGNQVLYDLCNKNFNHKEIDIILAKIWLIGRSYAAAIERRKNKKEDENNDDFYINNVAPNFKKSKLDNYLQLLKTKRSIKPENIEKILTAHYYLMQKVKQITELEKNSFCSKYLHFHLPNLFFIYDSRAIKGLRKFISRVPKELADYTTLKQVDQEYARFFLKCFCLKQDIEKKYKMKLSPREIDKILIQTANQVN